MGAGASRWLKMVALIPLAGSGAGLAAGCVSYSRHADLLADVQTAPVIGTCSEERYQNSFALKEAQVHVRAARFVESEGVGVVVPFQFRKSDALVFRFSDFGPGGEPRALLKRAQLEIAGRAVSPSVITEIKGAENGETGPAGKGLQANAYDVSFPVESLSGKSEVRLRVPPDLDIVFHPKRGWYFMPILAPQANACVATAEL